MHHAPLTKISVIPKSRVEMWYNLHRNTLSMSTIVFTEIIGRSDGTAYIYTTSARAT